MVSCPMCHREMYSISPSHLKFVHKISVSEFKVMFPNMQMVSDEKREKTSRSCKASGCGRWRKGAKMPEDQKRTLSRRNSGSGNPFFGERHSADTRLLMTKNHADFRGPKNPLHKALADPAKRAQYALLQKSKWSRLKNDEKRFLSFRKNVSIAITKAILDGKCKTYGRGHQHGWFDSTKQGTRIYYRSSYELDFLKWCESNKKTFCSCPFSIPYTSADGSVRQYLPDFLIDNKYVVEVKPKRLLNWDVNLRKFTAAKNFCSEKGLNYYVITKEDLENGCPVILG